MATAGPSCSWSPDSVTTSSWDWTGGTVIVTPGRKERTDGKLEMTSDALTNAGKHATLNISCERARDTHNIQSSDWPKMSLCIMGLTLYTQWSFHEVMTSVSI